MPWNTKKLPSFGHHSHANYGPLTLVNGRYVKELRLVEWGPYEPKFDIRGWEYKNGETRNFTKGCTFGLEEAINLRDILNRLNLETFEMPKKVIEPEPEKRPTLS